MTTWRHFFFGTAALALTACAEMPSSNMPDTGASFTTPAPTQAAELSETSLLLTDYYKRVQDRLLAQGLLRVDGGGADTPFTDTMLARNFVRIALFDEYTNQNGVLQAQTTLSKLRRWDKPVRMSLQFSDTTPARVQAADTEFIAAFNARLSRLTGLPVTLTSVRPNFHVLIVNEDDRRGMADTLRTLLPGLSPSSLSYALNLPREQWCVAIGVFEPDGVTYDRVVAIIRAEHPDLMRQTCIHEEVAQGLGLANDSRQARPSIFNDDEEFGFLTRQDELMLQMLYDDRFTIGMSAAEAAPLARRIATELMGGEV
jgi:hypothetical protein